MPVKQIKISIEVVDGFLKMTSMTAACMASRVPPFSLDEKAHELSMQHPRRQIVDDLHAGAELHRKLLSIPWLN